MFDNNDTAIKNFKKEIGECLISTKKRDYLFRPSFVAMDRVGEPREIVQALFDLTHDEVTPLIVSAVNAYGKTPEWLLTYVSTAKFASKAINASINVLTACCERDCSELTGELIPSKARPGSLVWKPGMLAFSEMIIIATSLMTHGIIGKAKIRRLQRDESSATINEFLAYEYVNTARIHFGMSDTESERLTMTEFTMLINAKYPPEKGFTREEYDQTADDFFAQRERRRARIRHEREAVITTH